MITRTSRRSVDSTLKAFTLLEVILSMAIMALLAASVYAITSSSITAARTAMDQQLVLRRLDAFLRITRNAFLNLPGQGTVALEIGKGKGGAAEPRLILGKVQGLFGIPSLGGASLMLAAKARSDGTRTICMVRIPARLSDRELEAAMNALAFLFCLKSENRVGPSWRESMGMGHLPGKKSGQQEVEVPAPYWCVCS